LDAVHPLLRRQLRRYFSNPGHQARSWVAFLKSVNEAYDQADTDRELLERSLDLTSGELLRTNAVLRTRAAGKDVSTNTELAQRAR